jgi:two-component system chemotaxis response regulator CheB
MGNNNELINVLIVDDSSLMRMIISDVLNSDARIKVIGVARNGEEAIQMAKDLNPDVITLDIEMPVMDGFTALKEILKTKFIPILMLSGIAEKEADVTIKALEYGAFDFISKPKNVFDLSNEKIKNDFIEKIVIAKNAVFHEIKKKPTQISIQKKDIKKSENLKSIVVIGASTGGPKSLKQIIQSIPGEIPAAFLIIQHMPKGFTKSLSERLDFESLISVKEAGDGDEIRAGFAYVAPGDYQMLIKKDKNDKLIIEITDDPPQRGHKPSVNVTLKSLFETGFKNIVTVILTGMGSDGSEGIKTIKQKSRGFIIAQDEKSSIVFGMPKAAISTGFVDKIVPLELIAKEITDVVEVQS